MDKITGNISPINQISGNITYGVGTGETTSIYEGQYDILPLAFEKTVLLTKNKRLTENLIIEEIPYYETTNLSGGTTVYIAGQVQFS